MKIIKNLHIIHKDKFDREFIEFINNNFKKEEHFFLLIHLPNTKTYDLVEEEDSNILNSMEKHKDIFSFKKSSNAAIDYKNLVNEFLYNEIYINKE